MNTAIPSTQTYLLSALRDESQGMLQFITLLQEEQGVLQRGETERLPALAEEKTRLANLLNSLAALRNNLLKKAGFTGDLAGMQGWCAAHAGEGEVSTLWQQILDEAREAKALNTLNGELIALRMHHNTLALKALQHTEGQTLSLYGPDGQSAIKGSAARISDSA